MPAKEDTQKVKGDAIPDIFTVFNWSRKMWPSCQSCS